MAWRCQKCDKNVFAPRKEAAMTFVLEWKYVKKYNDLSANFKLTTQLKEDSVITHVTCEGEPDNFKKNIRVALRVPDSAEHPLL